MPAFTSAEVGAVRESAERPTVFMYAEDLAAGGYATSFRARLIHERLSEFGYDVVTAGLRGRVNGVPSAPADRPSSSTLRDGLGLLRRAVAAAFSLPDRTVWASARLAFRAWVGALPRRERDAILVTSPPHTLILAGLSLQARSGAALVLDFRDDWMTNDRIKYRSGVHRGVARAMERLAVRSANAVILNTGVVAAKFAQRYPESAHKLFVVPNGYDDRDFSGVAVGEAERSPADPIVLGYFGSAYDGFAPETFRRLAVRVAEAGLPGRVRLVTGGGGPWDGAGADGVWDHVGSLTEQQAAAQMSACDALLLLMPPGEREPSGTIPLKAYSYLRSGAFVLYAGERGATTDLLSAFPRTAFFGRPEVDSIPEWCVLNASRLRPPSVPAGIERFEAREMVGQVARIIGESLEANLARREEGPGPCQPGSAETRGDEECT